MLRYVRTPSLSTLVLKFIGCVQVDAPSWPSEYSTTPPSGPEEEDPSLRWSTSGERHRPAVTNRRHRTDITSFGRQDFPRPQRIARIKPDDRSLILVFASPTARRAVMTAYSYWIRRELGNAYEVRAEVREEAKGVLPPIKKSDFMGLRVDMMGEALRWAEEVGWRPDYRLRSHKGRRGRKEDEWHKKPE